MNVKKIKITTGIWRKLLSAVRNKNVYVTSGCTEIQNCYCTTKKIDVWAITLYSNRVIRFWLITSAQCIVNYVNLLRTQSCVRHSAVRKFKVQNIFKNVLYYFILLNYCVVYIQNRLHKPLVVLKPLFHLVANSPYYFARLFC